MKKSFLFIFAALLFLSNYAMADSTAGKIGVNLRGGVGYFLNGDFTDEGVLKWGVDSTIKESVGWAGGGGIMYGITNNLSVDFDVIYGQVEVSASPNGGSQQTFGKGKTIDFSLGAQWRFMPESAFVPYIGAGLDFMTNSFDFYSPYSKPGETMDADNTYGGHLTVGADFFLNPYIALNAEFRGLLSTKSNLTRKYPGDSDFTAAEYNPSNISAFAGIKFFFPIVQKKEIAQAKVEEAPAPRVPEVKPEVKIEPPAPKVPEVKPEVKIENPPAPQQVVPVVVEKERKNISIILKVQFDPKKAVIKKKYHNRIKKLADFIKAHPETTIEIIGHTDNVGKEGYNMLLSQHRANSVRKYLIDKFGIDASRIHSLGYGPNQPIASNKTKEGRRKNERIEVVIEGIETE